MTQDSTPPGRRAAEGHAPFRLPLDFSITISVRSERPRGAAASAEEEEDRTVWGAHLSPRPGVSALATMGFQTNGQRELMACFLSSQDHLAETGLAAACFHARRLSLDLDAERPFAVPVCPLGGALAPGRGFLLAEPFIYEPGRLGESPPRWAIPLWPSEMKLLSDIGANAFLARAQSAGVDFLDWRRDGMFGEKAAPEPQEDPEAKAERLEREKAAALQAKEEAEAKGVFDFIKAAPFGLSFIASKGLMESCGTEIMLMTRQPTRHDGHACASILGGFLKAESPKLTPGFCVGPYGELPGAPGKNGFYFCALEERILELYCEQGVPFLRAIPVSAEEITQSKRMGQEAFESALLSLGDGLYDLARPCLFAGGSDRQPPSEPEPAEQNQPDQQNAERALSIREHERAMAEHESMKAQLIEEMRKNTVDAAKEKTNAQTLALAKN